jgi:DNA-damage-inducible protein D
MQLDSVHKALDSEMRIARNGKEYWMARDVQPILGYQNWQNFEKVIEKAKIACESTGVNPDKHFIDVNKKITAGKGAEIDKGDYFLSRLACYLIAMNGDPSKPEIGMAQAYFAVQTRKQEEFDQLTEDEKRLELRQRVRDHNRILSSAAKQAGVENFPRFQDAGYRGLYGGLGLRAIKTKKGISFKDDLLDRAGRSELAANDFRITQTEERLAGELNCGENAAVEIHHMVGEKVRKTIKELGGTMPENLAAEPHIKTLLPKRRGRKALPPSTAE